MFRLSITRFRYNRPPVNRVLDPRLSLGESIDRRVQRALARSAYEAYLWVGIISRPLRRLME